MAHRQARDPPVPVGERRAGRPGRERRPPRALSGTAAGAVSWFAALTLSGRPHRPLEPRPGLHVGLPAHPIAGQAALVTGASRGLGRAIAAHLLEAGLKVALVARTRAPMEALAATARPGHAVVVDEDLRDAAAGTRAVERAEASLGNLHVVIHAAAPWFPMQRLMQLDDTAIAEAAGTSLEACAGLFRAALPSMMHHRFGRLVVLSSLAASHGAAGSAMYAAGKGALEGLVRALAVDHGRHGVTANAVTVSFVDTERLRNRADEAARARLAQATTLKRIPEAEEVAGVVAFLCSPAAGVITGAVIPATAGAHLNTLW